MRAITSAPLNGLTTAQRAADVAAVAVGQREVEQDDREVALGELERAGGRAGDDGLEALASEGLGERLVDARLVLDEEDAGSWRLHGTSECSRARAGFPKA